MYNNYRHLIIVPSYNSKTQILKVVSGALKYDQSAKIIIVDDNSPDKTGQIVKGKFSSNKRVKVIIRDKKMGRGSAVILGMLEGLKDKNIRLFIEMDADLIHNPKDLPRMIKKSENLDIVVASR